MEVRGHTLVWAQDAYTPRWVLEITDPAELRAVLEEHITATIDRYEGRVRRWDVVNEPLDGTNVEGAMGDNVYARVLGPGWIAEVFAMARAADPGAELWINEWGTDYFPGRHEAFVSLVRDLREAGVPVDGVGLQTHRFFGGPTGPGVDAFARMLRDYADLGVDVAVTELDIPIDPADPDGLTRQAGAYQRIVSACLLVSRCQEVTTWGITDASTWLDTFVVPVLGPLPAPTRPLLFDEAGQPKPAYLAVRDTLAAATRPAPPPSSTAPTVSSPSTTVPVAAPIPAAPVTAAPRYTG
jgi:endo-1,4-beta-xylanase